MSCRRETSEYSEKEGKKMDERESIFRKRLEECFSSFSRQLADCIMSAMKEGTTEVKEEQKQPEQKTAKKAKVSEEEPTIEKVRDVLLERTHAGYRDKVKDCVVKYSKDGTLTGVAKENYSPLLREVKWSCRGPIEKREIEDFVSGLEKDGYRDDIPAVLGHHNAASLDDLKPEYYAPFMRDLEGLRYE